MAFRMAGVEFCHPVKVPWKRRLETTSVTILTFIYFLGFFFFPIVFIFLLFSPFYFLVLMYCTYWYNDRDTPYKGGRPIEWTNGGWFWRSAMDYFPIKVHKTADLDPSKKYMMAYHPHGLMIIGVFGLTTNNRFQELFPGLRPYIVALDLWFKTPFLRELGLAWNGISASAHSIEWTLKHQGPGTTPIIMVGGTTEMLDSVPKTMKLTLKKRKGFVKLAIRNGAQLVPVIAFGQNDIYNQLYLSDQSLFKKLQLFFTHFRGIPLPFFVGRGIFNYNIGGIPFRKPINIVVGAPLETPHIEQPTQEDIDEVHGRYIEHLQALYEEYKDVYAKDRKKDLVIA